MVDLRGTTFRRVVAPILTSTTLSKSSTFKVEVMNYQCTKTCSDKIGDTRSQRSKYFTPTFYERSSILTTLELKHTHYGTLVVDTHYSWYAWHYRSS